MTAVTTGVFAALAAGLLGSAHCVGMCGGIAVSVGASGQNHSSGDLMRVTRVLVFNLGRIGSYTLIGALVGGLGGWFGHTLNIPAWTGWLRIALGCMLLVIGAHIAFNWSGPRRIEVAGAGLWRVIAPQTRRLLPRRDIGSGFLLGMLWGWLPCGLVYTLLVTAAVSGDALSGAAIMAAFGLGTLPAMVLMGAMAAQLRRLAKQVMLRRIAGMAVMAGGIWTLAVPIATMSEGHGRHHALPEMPSSPLASVSIRFDIGQAFQAMHIQYVNAAPFDVDQAIRLKAGEHSTHGFHRQAQIIGDIASGHAEVEFSGGQAPKLEATGKTQQQRGESLFSAFLAQQKQQLLVLNDLPREQPHQLTPQTRNLITQLIEPIKRQLTNAGGFQRSDRAIVNLIGNGIQANQFAGKMKPRDLFRAVGSDGVAFNRTGPNGVNRFQRFPLMKQGMPSGKRSFSLDNIFQSSHLFLIDTVGKAKFTKAAVTTGALDVL